MNFFFSLGGIESMFVCVLFGFGGMTQMTSFECEPNFIDAVAVDEHFIQIAHFDIQLTTFCFVSNVFSKWLSSFFPLNKSFNNSLKRSGIKHNNRLTKKLNRIRLLMKYEFLSNEPKNKPNNIRSV